MDAVAADIVSGNARQAAVAISWQSRCPTTGHGAFATVRDLLDRASAASPSATRQPSRPASMHGQYLVAGRHLGALEPTHRAAGSVRLALAAVENGAADAAIVYRTDIGDRPPGARRLRRAATPTARASSIRRRSSACRPQPGGRGAAARVPAGSEAAAGCSPPPASSRSPARTEAQAISVSAEIRDIAMFTTRRGALAATALMLVPGHRPGLAAGAAAVSRQGDRRDAGVAAAGHAAGRHRPAAALAARAAAARSGGCSTRSASRSSSRRRRWSSRWPSWGCRCWCARRAPASNR